jgi:hypothetical protein
VDFMNRKLPRAEVNPAQVDAVRLSDRVVPLLNDARGVHWYDDFANGVDRAVVELCLLRRAGAGDRAAAGAGDDAVRAVLELAEPEAVIWLASRAISYMDEHGHPEAMARWFPEREREEA